MNEHRFDGRVAVVTGAGRGIGRAHALLLAERGASVVVNDLGGSMEGEGADVGPAVAVAEEIAAAGGAAVADGSDVSTPDGGQALIDAAVEHFGRLDVLVNNAGIMRWAGLPEVDAVDLERHLAVHVGGSFNTTRAAWPHLVDQGYGRIVMTTSAGFFGLPKNLAYATAKGGVIGLTRSLSTAGARHGIKVNLIAPAAVTRMAGPATDETPPMPPEHVAPMVAFLAHEHGGMISGHLEGRLVGVFAARAGERVDRRFAQRAALPAVAGSELEPGQLRLALHHVEGAVAGPEQGESSRDLGYQPVHENLQQRIRHAWRAASATTIWPGRTGVLGAN